MAPVDPHSYTDSDDPLTAGVDLHLKIDFDLHIIKGTAKLTLNRDATGVLNLDTRDLAIESAADAQGNAVAFEVAAVTDTIKGSLLKVFLHGKEVTLGFRTSDKAMALQWLAPEQTAGGHQPYVFTQCQPIHARSIFPCQDTPLARITYTARVEVPRAARVVMSAAHVGREEVGEIAVESFAMEQSIPPYLFALAAGDISFQELSSRVRVYAEPSVVAAAAFEFCNAEKMVECAEALFGPYEWGRFDVLVMPPSFPYGGMENPCIAFLTPSLLVGDHSLVNVLAHELAHSWTGNLISNANANHFWLNEGWTVYAERRILEALEGQDRLQLHAAIGRASLDEDLVRFQDKPELTRLESDLDGIDPDEVYSQVPYEKGYLFLCRLEEQVGRGAFDGFIRRYITAFRFTSITTHTFVTFLVAELPGIERQVDLQEWLHGTGVPADAPKAQSTVLLSIQKLAASFEGGQGLTPSDTEGWGATEWQVYIEALPQRLPHGRLAELDTQFGLSQKKNLELRVGFLAIAAQSGWTAANAAIEASLNNIGRMKYLRPLYKGLVGGGQKELAAKFFEAAKAKYHPLAQAVLAKVLQEGGAILS